MTGLLTSARSTPDLECASDGAAGAGAATPPDAGPSPVIAAIVRRRWAIVAIVAFTTISMAFTLLWGPVVRHTSTWVVPGDVWATFRCAHFVGWGDIGDIYQPYYGLLAFPGVVVLLAPVAMVSGHFGLTESLGTLVVDHPSAWLLLGPSVLLLGSTCFLAFDAMADSLGIGRGRRIALLVAESVVVFEVVTIWGHPEDMMAVGFAVAGLLAGSRHRWKAAGWWWGAAVVCQPLALVLFPLALAITPRGRRLALSARMAVPSIALLAIPLATRWSMTTGVMLHQENMLSLNHATPWVALSSSVGPDVVTAGPGRMIALAAACVIGLVAWRRRPTLLGLVWLAALALALRCFFESVMVPFYLGPPFALALLAVAARPGWRRPALAAAGALGGIVLSFRHIGEWGYWLLMVTALAVTLAAAWPGHGAFDRSRPDPLPAPPEDTAPGGRSDRDPSDGPTDHGAAPGHRTALPPPR